MNPGEYYERHSRQGGQDREKMKQRPFSIKRTVTWGDCDPAGMIFTPRVIDIAMEALEVWYRDIIKEPWVGLIEKGLGAPVVRAEVDYLDILRPDMEVDVEVRIESLGTSSITYLVRAFDGAGTDYFKARLVACIISRPDFKSQEIPADIRGRLEAYQAACGETG